MDSEDKHPDADPEDLNARIARISRRVRSRSAEAYAALLDLELWSRCPEPLQDLAAAEAARRLGDSFERAPITRFACGDLEHRIPVFIHKKTHSKLGLIPGRPPLLIGQLPVNQEAWDRIGGADERYFHGAKLAIDTVSEAAIQDWLERAGGDLRLPRVQEWQRACAGGSSAAYCFGDDPQRLADFAWYRENSGAMPQETGLKAPNAFGLHDMHGLISELCQRSPGAEDDVDGYPLCGGNFYSEAADCQTRSQSLIEACFLAGSQVGFRIARSL